MVELDHIWEDRIKIWGFALAISGAAWILLDQIIPQDYSMKKGHLLILIFISVSLIVGVYIKGVLSRKHIAFPTPKIVKYSATDYMKDGVFITRPSPLLNQSLIYGVVIEEEGGFERILGAAKFVMVQNNGLVQLMVISRNAASAEIWKRLDAGEVDPLNRVRIKMGMPENE